MPLIRVKRAKKGIVFVRKSRLQEVAHRISAEGSGHDHNHDDLIVPDALIPVIRRPLELYRLAKTKKRTNKQKKRLIETLQRRIDAHASAAYANRTILNPITILAWLSAEEPVNTEFLLEHADRELADAENEDPEFTTELDRLIERFNKSQDLTLSPKHDNFLLNVPKDYGVLTTPEAVDKHEFNIPMQDRPPLSGEDLLFKPFGGELGPSTPPEVGFDPVEMMKHAAIQFGSSDTPRFSCLTNEIHPIFREENFHGCPQDIYEVLRPSLQLATQFLTSKATAHHWHTLLYGERLPVPWLLQGAQYTRIRNEVPITPEHTATFNNLLIEIAYKSVHFTFEQWPSHKQGHWVYGLMQPIRDYKTSFNQATSDSKVTARLCLHSDFYITAKKLSILKSPDPAMFLRFNLFFAINIVHEIAHFLEMSGPHTRFRELDLRPHVHHTQYTVEPLMYDQEFSEMGAAFETRIFGGRIKPISLRTDCVHGLTTYDEEPLVPPLGAETASKTRVFYTVPMEYISLLQQQSTWDRDWDAEFMGREVDRWKVFHVPRDGTKALQVPYFDMTVWEDEMNGAVISDHGIDTPFKRDRRGVEAQP